MRINSNYLDLKDSYLFSRIVKKVNQFREQYPLKVIIQLGIGDVTLLLAFQNSRLYRNPVRLYGCTSRT